LNAVGLPDLATRTLADYEANVMELATDAGRRRAIRDHLVRARDSSPLFDGAGFAIDFGDLLRRMAEQWSQGLAPRHIEN
jgi:predicted O-linked N-acetylglucosamine transferase (SPINDLY family)